MMLTAPTLSKTQMNVEKPSNLNAHKAFHQERWGVFASGRNIGTFECERGYSTHTKFDSTTSVQVDE